MAIYRDPLEGLRNRLRMLRSKVDELEKTAYSRGGKDLVARGRLDAVVAASEGCRVPGGDIDQGQLMELCDRLERYHPIIAELAGRVARARAIWRLVGERGTDPLHQPERRVVDPDVIVPPDIDRWQDELMAIFASLSVPAAVKREDAGRRSTVLARFLYDRAPMSLLVQGNQVDTRPVLTMAAPVAAAGLALEVSPELARHWFLKGFGLVREIELGDDEFDGMFVIEGDHGSATRLLTESTRKALLAVAKIEIPHLSVGAHGAQLIWSYAYSIPTLRGAATALANIYHETGGHPIDDQRD